jgi:desulfoferrodoxin-like iron-binding protein
MPVSGQVYRCNVCDQVVKVLNGSDIPPECCESEMEAITDIDTIKKIPNDKNVCGAVLKCQNCNFKVILTSDEGTGIKHCMDDMKATADRTTGEWDQIYKCTSCGQIIKITKEGCGPMHCCDEDLCIMDVPQVNDLKDQIEIERKKTHDRPLDDPYLICTNCEREVKVIKQGPGKVICHDKDMQPRARIRYYFQGGGATF